MRHSLRASSLQVLADSSGAYYADCLAGRRQPSAIPARVYWKVLLQDVSTCGSSGLIPFSSIWQHRAATVDLNLLAARRTEMIVLEKDFLTSFLYADRNRVVTKVVVCRYHIVRLVQKNPNFVAGNLVL